MPKRPAAYYTTVCLVSTYGYHPGTLGCGVLLTDLDVIRPSELFSISLSIPDYAWVEPVATNPESVDLLSSTQACYSDIDLSERFLLHA